MCRGGGRAEARGPVKDSRAPVRNLEVEVRQEESGGMQSEALSGELDLLSLYMLESERPADVDPVMVELDVNGKIIIMELDTGVAVSVMSLVSYRRFVNDAEELQVSNLTLKTYTGELVKPEGVGMLDVKYEGQRHSLPVTLVNGNVPNLIGRDWLGKLKLRWEELFPEKATGIHQVKSRENGVVSELVEEFPEVFTSKLGCLKDFKVHIPIPDGARPKFCKARKVPYALRTRVEEELDRLEEQGVWERVSYSKWAAPIVSVLKDERDPSGAIRICGDYKVTVNTVAPLDTYPVPSTIVQLATLAGGEKFSKLIWRISSVGAG